MACAKCWLGEVVTSTNTLIVPMHAKSVCTCSTVVTEMREPPDVGQWLCEFMQMPKEVFSKVYCLLFTLNLY